MELTTNQIKKAFVFYYKHKEHIKNLIDSSYANKNDLPYSPTDIEDKNNPALWKANHWLWFMDHWNELINSI